MAPSLTVINDKGIKGLLMLGLSKREIEDIIDFVELSSPASQRETEERLQDKASRIPLKDVHAMLGKKRKSRRV